MVFQLPVLTGHAIKGRTLTALVAMIASTGFLLFGYDQGVMSGLINTPQFETHFPQITEITNPKTGESLNPRFDSSVQGAVVAIYEIGALFGSLVVLWKGDAIGRRSSIALGSLIMTVGAVIMTSSYGIAQFTVGRIITGIGNGLNTSTIPMWQSELSKAHNRGLLVLIEGALIAGGIMISYWVDYGFYQIKTSSISWRFPIAFQCIFALILFFGILCLPESPRWLVKKGHSEEAAKILAQQDSTTVDDPQVQSTLRQLEESIHASEKLMGDFSYRELFTNGPEQNFYRASIAFVAQAFQQLSGINLITYYATSVFLSIQPDDNTARLLTCGNGTEYFAASIVALFLIDTLGRRKLMMSTAFLMSASMAVLTGTVYDVQRRGIGNGGGSAIVAAIFLYFFNTCFALGWLGMTWLYPPEITPIRIRAPASAIATSSNWLFNFLIVMITPPSFASIAYKTYIIFAVLNLSFVPVIYCFFPETKRRGLEEMDIIFAESIEDTWFVKSRFMTRACYLSITKPHLTSSELDAELTKRFGSGAAAAGASGAGAAGEKYTHGLGPSPHDEKADHDDPIEKQAANAGGNGTHENNTEVASSHSGSASN